MCYLDVPADAEVLLASGEERVRHLLSGGLDLLLHAFLRDNLIRLQKNMVETRRR